MKFEQSNFFWKKEEHDIKDEPLESLYGKFISDEDAEIAAFIKRHPESLESLLDKYDIELCCASMVKFAKLNGDDDLLRIMDDFNQRRASSHYSP